jgi:hypothetical protein
MAFVYLLRHTGKLTFKIGKAVDIHDRIPGIGGYQAFDLNSSMCAKLPTPSMALRVEKLIHEIFKEWNEPPIDKSNRAEGDTEYFRTECFDLVIGFLHHNQNYFKSEITRVPERVATVEISLAEKRERKRLKQELRQQEVHLDNAESLERWKCFQEWLKENEVRITNVMVVEKGYTRIEIDPGFSDLESAIRDFTNSFLKIEMWRYWGSFSYGAYKLKSQGSKSVAYLQAIPDDVIPTVERYSPPGLADGLRQMNAWINGLAERTYQNDQAGRR